MSGLSVYYCSKCGYYGYYQLQRNAVCPKCRKELAELSISYQDFMDLSCEARDELLSAHIIAASSPYVRRLLAPHKVNNNRENIALMGQRITELEIENEKLNKTIEWMHQTIWELMRKIRGIDSGSSKSSRTGIDP
jgi:septal ring factor EnvC (AmiA/AmiB activator)